jgi:hypothetical protein
LTVLNEPNGFLGGYLVTNQWGRPLEFRLTSAVQPNRVQQILYGKALEAYLCSDLIGKTLVEKTGTAAHVIFTDCAAALDLRLKVDVPVAWLATQTGGERASAPPRGVDLPAGTVSRHIDHVEDGPVLEKFLEHLEGMLDLAEPFNRVRGAIGEARKMGVTGRG